VTKLCTIMTFDDPSHPIVTEISVVPDDHEFGWHDGKLHYEGQITIKPTYN
jgi:hypothetical protein